MVGKVNSAHNDRLQLPKRSSNYRCMVMSNTSGQHRYQVRRSPTNKRSRAGGDVKNEQFRLRDDVVEIGYPVIPDLKTTCRSPLSNGDLWVGHGFVRSSGRG